MTRCTLCGTITIGGIQPCASCRKLREDALQKTLTKDELRWLYLIVATQREVTDAIDMCDVVKEKLLKMMEKSR
jgi:hypothetical protein